MPKPLFYLEMGSVQRQHQCVSIERSFGGQEMKRGALGCPLTFPQGRPHACVNGLLWPQSPPEAAPLAAALDVALLPHVPSCVAEGCGGMTPATIPSSGTGSECSGASLGRLERGWGGGGGTDGLHCIHILGFAAFVSYLKKG